MRHHQYYLKTNKNNLKREFRDKKWKSTFMGQQRIILTDNNTTKFKKIIKIWVLSIRNRHPIIGLVFFHILYV